MSSNVNGEHVMDTKSVLPLTPEVDALPIWDTIPILSISSQNCKNTFLTLTIWQAPLWSTAADEELIYAKKEITNAPLTSDDPDLYAPLFRNVSIFKR
jgi:hypothetical protein